MNTYEYIHTCSGLKLLRVCTSHTIGVERGAHGGGVEREGWLAASQRVDENRSDRR